MDVVLTRSASTPAL